MLLPYTQASWYLRHFLQRRDIYDIFASRQGTFCSLTFSFIYRRNDILSGRLKKEEKRIRISYRKYDIRNISSRFGVGLAICQFPTDADLCSSSLVLFFRFFRNDGGHNFCKKRKKRRKTMLIFSFIRTFLCFLGSPSSAAPEKKKKKIKRKRKRKIFWNYFERREIDGVAW